MRLLQIKNRRTCFLFCLALAAGTTFVPLPANASPTEQITQQTSTVRGKILTSDGEPALGAIIKAAKGNTNAIADCRRQLYH